MAIGIKLYTLPEQTVTTAGTRVELVDPTADLRVTTVIVQADPSNTGKIYVGDELVSATRALASLSPGQVAAITADASGRAGWEEYFLSDFWLDASVNGDKAYVSYIRRRSAS